MRAPTEIRRTCADCGGLYSVAAPRGKAPAGHRICPRCGSGNTEILGRLRECRSCGGFHRANFRGNCRDPVHRFRHGLPRPQEATRC